MRAILVHPDFERVWPLVAERLRERWPDAEFHRLDPDDDRAVVDVLDDPASATQLIPLGVPLADPDRLPNLQEVAPFPESAYGQPDDLVADLEERGVTVHDHDGEGYWGQSVSECALGLTIAALRRIPQLHQRMQSDRSPWDYEPDGTPGPGKRGHQYGDTPDFTSGTVAGKRVRVVGVGNIGSRYADSVDHLGASVAAYDPYADEPCFHRAGAERVHSLSELVEDAEIFAPLVPPAPTTEGLIDADLIDALPTGALVVLATRARIVDTDALRARVLDDELSLAADVWDENPGEPVPLDDPLLGRHNVVHTPHIAGRTRHANEEWADRLVDRFE